MTIFFETGTKIEYFVSFFIKSLKLSDNDPVMKFDDEAFLSNKSVLILNY